MLYKISKDDILSQIYDMRQRGERMLSIIDLIQAGTISIELAVHLIALIVQGITIASGSLIGGTGKTTLLASLLAFLPLNRKLVTVTESNLKGLQDQSRNLINTTFLCHEVSPAHYYSYLWGRDLKLYFNLKRNSNNLAFTIHADTPEEVFPQIVNEHTGLDTSDFYKIDAMIFIKAFNHGLNISRRVTSLYERSKNNPSHILTFKFNEDRFIKLNESSLLYEGMKNYKKRLKELISYLINNNIHKIEDVRARFLSLLPQVPQ